VYKNLFILESFDKKIVFNCLRNYWGYNSYFISRGK